LPPKVMEVHSLPTEVILSSSKTTVGKLVLDWIPQPGDYLDIAGYTYTVLERRHCYQYKAGRYRLAKISIHVQESTRPAERSLLEDRWVIGDATCLYNAHSELLRCAVLPGGPCQGCGFYQLRSAGNSVSGSGSSNQ
jgi:Family of unknown function (DUF6464)